MPFVIRLAVSLRLAAAGLVLLAAALAGGPVAAQGTGQGVGQRAGQPAPKADPLPSWNAGANKAAILDFIAAATDPAGPGYVPPAERIATFDQDGTLWVEQPVYSEVAFAVSRVRALAERNPALKTEPPFSIAYAGDEEALGRLPFSELKKIMLLAFTGVSVETLREEADAWLATAKNPRFGRLRTELVYQPMLEVLALLRANGFRTYIVTGGGQDFVRAFSDRLYGVPPEQVVGSADASRFGYDAAGRPVLTLEPKLLLEDVFGGKPEGIHLVIGRRPTAAFGNSTGDRQMLEYARAGRGTRLAMLVLHDDGAREAAYGPALGLPDSAVGTFTQALYDEAKAKGWGVISMKGDWKRVFPFER